MHIGKGKTVSTSLQIHTDYAKNPDKTDGGQFISSYGCAPEAVDAEFLLTRKIYFDTTGRTQNKKNDVLAYQLRQSFAPGEITPETANKIGYELAKRWTKGNYQFIVCTHVDKHHIHNHIIYCATAMDGNRKFDYFWRCSHEIRKLSDQICVEHGLGIIKSPKFKGCSYEKWLGKRRPLSERDKLRQAIDDVLLTKSADMDALLSGLSGRGYEIMKGKYLSFRETGKKRFIRCRSLGKDYSETALLERIAGKRIIPKKQHEKTTDMVNLLIDIQSRLQAGKGSGYERWAKVFNLKQMAKTMNYLSENHLLEYDQLQKKASEAEQQLSKLTSQIRKLESKMKDISELEKHIFTYSKTRDVYISYRKSGYSRKFYEEHEQEILQHKAAKEAFNNQKLQKIPTVKSLKIEYAELLEQKKKLYPGYQEAKKDMQEAAVAKANVDRILDKKDEKSEHGRNKSL